MFCGALGGDNVTDDYLGYYDLESYLFETVRKRFHSTGKIDAFDLFSIIIWKAERAKSRLAHRVIEMAGDLEAAAERFTSELSEANSPQERLMVAMEGWGFYLPMASAILTVLWPDDFTVYDVRACDQLRAFQNLGNLSTKHLWPEYLKYRDAVRNAVPQYSTLREKDKFLWGRSAAQQLVSDIAFGFPKTTEPNSDSARPITG